MARQGETTGLERIYEVESEENEIDSPNMPVKLSDKILAGLENDDVGMTVSRRVKGKKRSFLFELDEFEDLPALMTLLRDEYHGGDFIIEGKYSNGTWAFQQTITVEPPIVKKEENNHNPTNDIATLISAMNESNRSQMDMMREQMHSLSETMMRAQLESAKSQSDMLVKMMEINSNKKDDSMGPQEIIALMSSVKELSGGNNDNPMELFLKGMEFGRDSESGKDESILQTALKTFGAPLASLAQAGNIPGAASMPVQSPRQLSEQPVQQPEQQPEQSPEQSPEQLPENEDTMLAVIKQFAPYIQLLLNAAATDSDPEPYAVMILDAMETDKIEGFLRDKNKFDGLLNNPLLSNAKPYREWFDQLRDITLAYIDDEKEPENGEPVNNVPEQEPEPDISKETASSVSRDTETPS